MSKKFIVSRGLHPALFLFLPPLLAACDSLPLCMNDPVSPVQSRAVVIDVERTVNVADIASVSLGMFAEQSDHMSSLTAAELAIWNDPSFQRRFAESYLAETEIEPRVTSDERDKLLKVMELIASDQLDKAAAQLERHRARSASAVFDFTLANIHFQQGQWERAAELYSSAVEKFPKFRRAWKNLGLIHIRRQEFANAAETLTRVIELGGGDGTTYGLLGFAYASTENHLAAESAYRFAILLDPSTMDWKMGLARSFFRQNRYSEAVALMDHLIEDDPGRAELWLLQANAYIGLGEPARAAENFEIVDRLGGSTVESLSMLADIYVNEELFDLAVDTYIRAMESVTEVKPERPMRAAAVLTSRGAVADARRLIERIDVEYELEPSVRKELLKLRARIAVADGAGDEEARVLEEIVAIDPLDGEALILLGQYCSRSGDNEKAAFYFEQAAGIEKFEADAKVRHAQLLVGTGRYAEALPLLRRAQQLKPRENIQEYMEQVERIARAR